MTKLKYFWRDLRSSFWFVPSLIIAFSITLAVTLIQLDSTGSRYIPSLALLFGVVLAIGGISVLIFFIHHIASSIQASNIIASVAAETIEAVDRLFPERLGKEPVDDDETKSPEPLLRRNWKTVPASRNGYIQSVDNSALLHLARKHKTVMRMERSIGEIVVRETTLASLALDVAPSNKTVAARQGAYSISRYRTVEQDSAFGI